MAFSYDYNKSLGYLTGLTSRLLSNTLAARFKAADIDLTAEQWGAVVVLLDTGGMTQGELGERLCLEKSSVSRLLDGLERRNWVVRTRDPKDGRHKMVTPAPGVLEAAERGATIAEAVLEDAQKDATEEEKSAGLSFLSRLIANLNEMNGWAEKKRADDYTRNPPEAGRREAGENGGINHGQPTR